MSDPTDFAESTAAELRKEFLVVGMGGSAGSIPAFREFFRNVPVDSGMAFVVILHLSPEHDSHLAEVLQASSPIPVMQVREQVKVEPNNVYVIPPNRSLEMSDGSLVLSPVNGFEERRAPVDIFFRTLGDAHDSRAVCVILSGSGSDGSMGLRHVKEQNGLILVQDPGEAQFEEMPRHAIATGCVDMVLPVAEMPARIISYRDQIRTAPLDLNDVDETDEQALNDIFASLRAGTGHDFSNYKRATMLRRIERRMALHFLPRLQQYAQFIRERTEEPGLLLRELLISVTNFFRDPQVWERVEQRVVPDLLQGKGAGDHVRVWVAGCATGEEAYSIAMLLAEAAAKMPAAPDIHIFATDLDSNAIAKARNGVYSEADVADISPERLRSHFIREETHYRVCRELRELILFAHHNLLKDPPFSHIDLVLCRNVLIYLNREAQERTMELLHFALEPGGWLLLGTAESSDASSRLFSTADKENHLYVSRAVPRVIHVPTPARGLTISSELRAGTRTPDRPEAVTPRLASLNLHHQLVEEYAPPSLIVDEAHRIVHLSERAGHYLQFPAGEASLDVMQVIRPELRIALRTALFQAEQTRVTTVLRNIEVHTGERSEVVNLIVRPTPREGKPEVGYFLVLFEESREHAPIQIAPPSVEPAGRQLEEELTRGKAQLRATVEQYEVQAEEARAANEELQAVNEELRSTAEELETSQEELQSLNEELQTVNQELKVKIEEIGHTNDDLRNLMSSTEIGTIFVDRGLRVKLFTPRVLDLFNLIPADVGRPLLDINHKLTTNTLASDLDLVLGRLNTIERDVESRDGRWYLMRLLPYRTSEDRIGGVVLTFLEITEKHRAQEVLRETQERQTFLLKLSDALRELSDPAEIQASASRVLGEHLHTGRAYYVEIDRLAGEYIVNRGWHARDEPSHGDRYPLDSWPMPWLSNGRTWACTDANTDPVLPDDQRALYRQNSLGAVVVVPLIKGGILVATFFVSQSRPREWTAHEIAFVEETAERTWAAVERARAEDALRVSEHRLQRMVNVPGVGVLTFDADEIINHANDAFLNMIQYTREDLAGRKLSWRDITPDENVDASLDIVAQLRQKGQGGPYEKEYLRKDGSRIWLMYVGAEIGGGNVVEYVVDVSDRKEVEAALRRSEERYVTGLETEVHARTAQLKEQHDLLHATMNSSTDLIHVFEAVRDAAGTIVDFRWLLRNQAAQSMLGELRGESLLEKYPGVVQEGILDGYQRVVETGKPHQKEFLYRHEQIDEWFLESVVKLNDGVAVTARTITEWKRAQEDLQKQTDELSDLSAQRQQLLGRLVAASEDERKRIARELHDEMGQHLTALRVGLHTMDLRAGDPTHLKEIIDRLDQSVDRLTLELRPPALDHLGLHSAIHTLAEQFSAASGIQIDVHLRGLEGKRFRDEVETAVYRVAQEALTNAWKHSAAATVSVIVERDPDALRMIVEDNGHGFDGDGSLDGEIVRGRFGLLGMRERLALVGGTIKVESQKGSGTTIYVRVPLQDDGTS